MHLNYRMCPPQPSGCSFPHPWLACSYAGFRRPLTARESETCWYMAWGLSGCGLHHPAGPAPRSLSPSSPTPKFLFSWLVFLVFNGVDGVKMRVRTANSIRPHANYFKADPVFTGFQPNLHLSGTKSGDVWQTEFRLEIMSSNGSLELTQNLFSHWSLRGSVANNEHVEVGVVMILVSFSARGMHAYGSGMWYEACRYAPVCT